MALTSWTALHQADLAGCCHCRAPSPPTAEANFEDLIGHQSLGEPGGHLVAGRFFTLDP